jgi:hypothetical protein
MPVDVWNMHLYILPERQLDGSPSGVGHIALGTDPNLAIYQSDGTAAMCGDPADNVYCFAEHDDIDIFADQVRAMRRWMKTHGQQHKPLILTEFGMLYPYQTDGSGMCTNLRDEFGQCFDPVRVSEFMVSASQFLESEADPLLGFAADNNRLVQQWLWFSLYTTAEGQSSNLLVDGYDSFTPGNAAALTSMGQTFLDVATTAPFVNNLVVVDGPKAYAFVNPGSGEATVTLQALIGNNGNIPVEQSITVAFYADEALTQKIGEASVGDEIAGCARRAYSAVVPWTLPGEGSYQFWIMVDPENDLIEADETDNVFQGSATVLPTGVWLPLLYR